MQEKSSKTFVTNLENSPRLSNKSVYTLDFDDVSFYYLLLVTGRLLSTNGVYLLTY